MKFRSVIKMLDIGWLIWVLVFADIFSSVIIHILSCLPFFSSRPYLEI
jgi:hypothetical protein